MQKAITRFTLSPMLLVTLCVLSGCQTSGEHAKVDFSTRTIRVVTTTGMIADMVQNIGGARVHVEALMGPGVDPHLYKASEGDVRRLSMADVIFYNGLHLEGAMSEVFKEMHGRQRTVAVSDAIDRSRLTAPPEFGGNHDPHIWFDVSLWAETIDTVRGALSAMDPGSAALYHSQARAYRDSLQVLHDYIVARAAEVPETQRVLITAHDAFNYFGRAYGFDVRGLQGISTVAEAGTADVQALADFIATRRIPAIFVESSVPRRSIEAVQAAVRSRGFEVAIGGQLFSDAMGSPGTPEGTYLGMVRANINTIVEALRLPADPTALSGQTP